MTCPEYDDYDERCEHDEREGEFLRESDFLEGPEWELEKALRDDEFWAAEADAEQDEWDREANQAREDAQRGA